jgi:N-methylhydantoinase A
MARRIGVDVGGTFTDLILFDDETGTMRVGKAPSTPSEPDVGVLDVVGIAAADALADTEFFLHGTTVGLNALLERKGARVGILTTAGFRDVLQIRRSSRPEAYNVMWVPPEPLVERHLRLEAHGRILADGTVETPLNEDDVALAAQTFEREDVECIAIVFINSYANPEHELAAERLLRAAGYDGQIALSHAVTGEYSEYERTSTTVVDAYVRPVVSTYFTRLVDGLGDRGFAGQCLVTRSGGGAMYFDEAVRRPFETVMSGPVAGVAGAIQLSRELGLSRVITADVGGTSFDTSLIIDGQPELRYEGEVVGFPLQTPWVDVRSIGAGGGSIAYAAAGLLRVGPRSAGARPGPVSYGHGGVEPTVTDAAAVLGMLADGKLAGGLELDIDAARAAVEALGRELGIGGEETAAGIVTIANAAMAGAISEITIERGEDPREATIVAFGGAGPLFGGLLARELDVGTIVVPNAAGNFSAWGLLCEDVARSRARTFIRPLTDAALEEAVTVFTGLFAELDADAGATPQLGERTHEPAFDLRYMGQEHTLTIHPVPGNGTVGLAELTEQFSVQHERLFGHRLPLPVQTVSLRATVRTPLPNMVSARASAQTHGTGTVPSIDAYSFLHGERMPFAVRHRPQLGAGDRFSGPAIVLEETSVTYIDDACDVEVHDTGALMITNHGG